MNETITMLWSVLMSIWKLSTIEYTAINILEVKTCESLWVVSSLIIKIIGFTNSIKATSTIRGLYPFSYKKMSKVSKYFSATHQNVFGALPIASIFCKVLGLKPFEAIRSPIRRPDLASSLWTMWAKKPSLTPWIGYQKRFVLSNFSFSRSLASRSL